MATASKEGTTRYASVWFSRPEMVVRVAPHFWRATAFDVGVTAGIMGFIAIILGMMHLHAWKRTQLRVSARAFHRTLKLSRTIADLAGSDVVGAAHEAEAIQYRPRHLV